MGLRDAAEHSTFYGSDAACPVTEYSLNVEEFF
jgi:hypothetical protein